MDTVGFSLGPAISLIGGVARVVLPVVTPIAVGIGGQWLQNQLMPAPAGSSMPSALSDPVASARNDQHQSNLSTTIGIVAAAGIALYFITKRR